MVDWNREPAFDLNGKRALVVGFGNPGGRGIALALAEAGSHVAVASATLDGDEVMAAKRVAKEVEGLGRESMSQGWDVTLPTNVQVGLRQVVKEFGKPSILVFNANRPALGPITSVTDTEVSQVLQTNLAGAIYTARSFLKERDDSQPGRLIFLTSVIGERGVDNAGIYAAAKAGVTGLSNALSQEFGAHNLTSNCIATGWMSWTRGRGSDEMNENVLLRFIPMRRFGDGDELGGTAVLLASDAAGYINGEVIHVDGGVTTHL